ncbi:TIGR04219 family outer membrane beta-barrel protein [Rheinheimera sp.]|uniref:TIGR04219 family outer membrane beta-barrel protein n=1 Tax=Rheinheimera sp. TaxID=1869214 RepID=UPI00404783E5
MKKTALILSLSSMLLGGAAQADTILGIYAGADGWRTAAEGSFASSDEMQTFNFADKTQQSFYLALEHPVPLLPNVRIQHNPLESEGLSNISAGFNFAGETFTADTQVRNQVDLTSTDYVLYYEILDNDLISIDFGINGKYIDGYVAVAETSANGLDAGQDVSQWLPMLYTSAAVGLPLTGVTVFANGSFLSYDGSRVYDAQAGIAYALLDNLAVDLTLKLGYRAVNLRLDDIDDLYANLDFKGVFAGIELHF